MANPLLEPHLLPPFSRIKPEHVEPAIRELIEANKLGIERLLENDEGYTWDNLLQPIEELEDQLAKAWSPVSHLNGVCNSEALRAAYNACLPLLSEYSTWMGQHSDLCAAYQQIADGKTFVALETAQQKAINQALRDFRLAGVALPSDEKMQYGELRQRLSKLGSAFAENVLDATNAWSKQVTAEQLRGLPETALASAKQAATAAGQQDYLINLEFPSLSPVLNYCDDRKLREEVYTAHCTRASELGPHGDKWDNTALITDTLQLRNELSQLLEFENYAELSLATKMAESPASVMDFLQQLADQSLPQAKEEWRQLVAFARDDGGPTDLQSWDVGYYSEKLRQNLYQVSQQDIRPYLPIDRVLPGLFEVLRRLYEVDVNEVEYFDSYHPDVKLFELLRDGEVIARFFLDLYARAHKRGGPGWTTVGCAVRLPTACKCQWPIWCVTSPPRWATVLPCSPTMSLPHCFMSSAMVCITC